MTKKMYAVMRTTYTPSQGGAEEHQFVEFVTFDKKTADDFAAEKNSKNVGAWCSTFDVEEVEVR